MVPDGPTSCVPVGEVDERPSAAWKLSEAGRAHGQGIGDAERKIGDDAAARRLAAVDDRERVHGRDAEPQAPALGVGRPIRARDDPQGDHEQGKQPQREPRSRMTSPHRHELAIHRRRRLLHTATPCRSTTARKTVPPPRPTSSSASGSACSCARCPTRARSAGRWSASWSWSRSSPSAAKSSSIVPKARPRPTVARSASTKASSRPTIRSPPTSRTTTSRTTRRRKSAAEATLAEQLDKLPRDGEVERALAPRRRAL